MADNKVDILYDLKVQENRVKRELEDVNKVIKTADRRTTKYKDAVKATVDAELKLANIRKQRISINKNVEKSVKSLTKAQVQAKDASGATTSAALELGRVVSDAPYGIRGMANNLTQLASQMAFATKKMGSFKAAMGGVIKSMTGSLGVVFAITAVISAFDWLYGANKKTEKSTDDLKTSFEDLAKVLRDNVNASISEYINLLDKKSLMEKNLLKDSDELANIEKSIAYLVKERARVEKYASREIYSSRKNQILAAREVIRLDELINQKQQERIPIFKEATDKLNEYQELMDEYNRSKKGTVSWLKEEVSLLTKQRDRLSDSSETWDYYTKKIDKANEFIKEITGSQKDLNKEIGESSSVMFSDAWYSATISSLKKFRDEQTKLGSEAYKRETKIIERLQKEYDKLRNKGGFEGEKVKAISPEMIDPAKLRKFAEKQLKEIKRAFGDRVKENPMNLSILERQLTDEEIQAAKDYAIKIGDEVMMNIRLRDFGEVAEEVQKGLSAISDFTNAQYDRQLTIEQNHTNALNEELNNRLLNEKLSASERANIQNQIAQNDEASRKKQNEIKKKQFNTQKAYNISNALIDTGRAAAGVMADASGGFFARLSQAIPTIAFGLAQVASIASQKFQPDAASTPIRTASGGSTGGSGNNRTFDFNLVGNNQNNQLAQAIGGQFEKPIKAYVVSKDITNQQQLDANTKSTARFGG